jgi:ribosomal protein S18 acetylase RimI-like enzyme
MPPIRIVEADLSQRLHQEAIVRLTDAYARDAFGNGQPLTDAVRRAIVPGLQTHPGTVVFIAYQDDEPVGLATCFRGFSTFAGRPLINIHDLAVLAAHRGRGIGRQLLQAVETRARETGCCRVTLEVREDNATARRIYEAAGFGATPHEKAASRFLFLVKAL